MELSIPFLSKVQNSFGSLASFAGSQPLESSFSEMANGFINNTLGSVLSSVQSSGLSSLLGLGSSTSTCYPPVASSSAGTGIAASLGSGSPIVSALSNLSPVSELNAISTGNFSAVNSASAVLNNPNAVATAIATGQPLF